MRKKRGLVVLSYLLVSILVLSMTGVAYAKPGNDSRKIVVFNGSVNELEKDKVIENYGGKKIKSLSLINASVVTISSANEKALQKHASVLRIDPDVLLHTQKKPTPVIPAQEILTWGVDRIDADLVWDRDYNLVVDPGANAGNGVKVAVLDTGIALGHPDLMGNIKGGINTINRAKSADDDNGHGTHVAGIIAAVDNTIGLIGVAPQASLYAVKVLSRTGSGFLSDIIEGLQWSINNEMQVVNMSFSTSIDVQSFQDAITAAHNSGIVLVAAAGNSGPGDNTVQYPAKYQEVIAVSATDVNDAIASWSSRGSEVELAAPGADIYSTYKGGDYKTLSGTSMASPHVAGTAALIIASGTTNVNEVRAKLQGSADDLGLVGRDHFYGFGIVDAEEAVTGIQTNP